MMMNISTMFMASFQLRYIITALNLIAVVDNYCPIPSSDCYL